MLLDGMREELVQGFTDIFQNNISMIILYGSVARNETTDESDIDSAIIIKKKMDDQTKKRFIRLFGRRGLFYGGQLKRVGRIPIGESQGYAVGIG